MSNTPGDSQPKLIIDTDWKAQAQAEKERLSSASPKPAAKPAAGSSASAGGAGMPANSPMVAGAAAAPDQLGPEDDLPREAGLQDLVSVLVTQALVYLGAFPDPKTGQAMVALDYAKLHIDLLAVLEQKTRGNTTEAEAKLLTRAVGELRMEYVEVAKAVEQAIAQGKIRPGAMGGPGPGVGKGPGAVPPPKIDFGGFPKA